MVLTFLNGITDGRKPHTKKTRFSHLTAFFNFIKSNIDQSFQNPSDIPMMKKLFRAKSSTNWNMIEKETVDEIIFKTDKLRNRLILELMARGGTYCGEYQFDRDDPVNDGVVRDNFGGFTNTASTFRIIDYIDPETGEEIAFYTTLSRKIRPGVICWLYFLRWKIEKVFDCFKNVLGERKAWAVGLNALQIQGCSICIIYNFIQFLSETIQEEYQCMDKKAEKKYVENLAKRLSKAKAQGRSIHPLLLFSRFITRISSQFIRVVRNHFSSKKPLRLIIPLFIQRLEAYL